MTPLPAPITIRWGSADDQLPLSRLAALDSAAGVPPSPLLLAEVDGELRAALSLRDGSVIADPFFATANLLVLLRMRAEATTRPIRHRWLRTALAAPSLRLGARWS
jgi:hypothetical protein